MRKEFFDKLCCPFDKSDLNLKVFKKKEGDIFEGIMSCAACNRYFPIIYGIPIMTPDEYRQHQLEAPILKRWGLQLDSNEQRFRLGSLPEVGKSSSGRSES